MRTLGLTGVVFLLSCSPARRGVAPPREVVRPIAASDASSPEDATRSEPAAVIDAAPESSTGVDAANDSAASLGACPATFKSGGGACAPFGKACSYPEGTCTCASMSYCGGVGPTPEMLAALKVPRWICEPSPNTLGPDGCPLGIPSGLACKTPGKKCHYTPCCAFTVTCSGGKWVPGSPSCPP